MTEKRDDLYLPSREFVEQAHIQSRAEYERMMKQSIEDPGYLLGLHRKKISTGSNLGHRFTVANRKSEIMNGSSVEKQTFVTTVWMHRLKKEEAIRLHFCFRVNRKQTARDLLTMSF